MLTMYFSVMFLLCFSVANCQKKFFVIKTYPNSISLVSNYLCTTNSSFGLSWIGENAESTPGVSKFVPPLLGKNPFENIDAPQNWFVQKSLDGFVKEAILDWRWENLQEYKTKHVQDYLKSLDYVSVLQNLKINFTIPLSILTDEAHIFLCNGSNVSESSCYWLLMQAFNGTKTGFRKCDPNYIPTINNKFPNKPCENLLEEKTHPEDFPKYIGKDKWSHFKLEKSSNQITLSQVSEGSSRAIITYFDNEDAVINATHMIIHSKVSNGLWKIHEVEYMYTTEQTNRIRFGEVITVLENSVCISMFISMCTLCRIILTISSENDPSLKLHEDIFYTQSGWREIKLSKENINEQKVILLVSTINTNNSNINSFWAISGMRQCVKKENRYISTSTLANCQLVSNTENIISIKTKPNNNNEHNCPDKTISSFCVPCSWFLKRKECGRVKIYEKYETATKFSCSAGYIGNECESPCFDGDYGHSCRKKCGKCENVCNKINGKCKPCTGGYSGEKCEIAPKNVRNIKTTSFSPSSVQIEWDKPLFYLDDGTKDLLYTIKYQHKRYRSCAQETTDTIREASITVSEDYVILDKLKPYSKYSISIFVSHKNEKGPEEIREFETDSLETIEEQEIPDVTNISPNSREAAVTFSNVDCKTIRGPLIIKIKATCENPWCQNDTKTNANYRNNVSIGLKNLMPFSRYHVEIQFCRSNLICSQIPSKKIFDTKSSAPKIVRKLEVYTKNENSVSLRWLPPYPPRGNLESYILSYLYNNDKHSKNFTIAHCPLWPDFHCATLTDLVNSTNYSIKVMAKNKEVSDLGQEKAIDVVTKIEPSDAPYKINIHWTLENDLELDWKHPNRTNGDIQFFKITITAYEDVKVKNKIDKELSVPKYKLTYHYKINATYFLPSTSYNISISAFNGYEGRQSVNIDKSPPSIPSLNTAPKIIHLTNTTITVEILTNKLRGKNIINEYNLFILGFYNGSNIQSHPELEKFKKDFQISLPKFKMLYTCDLRTLNTSHFTIGNNEDIKECTRKTNYSLNSQDSFNITIILTNNNGNKSRYKLYYISNSDTTTSESKDLRLLALLSLLLILSVITAIVYYYYCYKKRKPVIEQHNSFENIKLVDSFSNSVPVAEFPTYVKMWINHEKLKQEYYKVTRPQFEPIYNEIKEEISIDYVDMCFSKWQTDKAYVVSTMPQQKNSSFWKTVWIENVKHIVLIDNLSENESDIYWPEESVLLEHENISVRLQFKKFFPDYEYRKFSLTVQDNIKHVDQIRFTSWINKEEPLHFLKLVPLIKRISEILLNSQSPILIHSRREKEGIGLVLLSDMCLRMSKKEDVIDVLKILQKLTHSFNITIDNVWQYQVAHLVVAEILTKKDTSLNLNSFDKNSEFVFIEHKLKKHLRYLNNTKWLDISMGLIIEDIKKYGYCISSPMNPDRDLVPLLPRKKQFIDPNNIKTVVVDGFRNPSKFLITKQPSSENFDKFWKCISENNISAIISLNEPIKQQNKFWPNDNNKILSPSESISVKYKESIKFESFKVIMADLLHHGNSQNKRNIKIILLKNCICLYNCPPFVYDFVKFCIESNKISEALHPVLITCSDGITASGLYVTMLYNIEKIIFENICDISTSVRIMRLHCQEFIRDEEQFKFIYHATLEYFKNFQDCLNVN